MSVRLIILLMGPPGSGKGTQGKFLANYLKKPHLSVGDILRGLAQDKEQNIVSNYVKSGKLVPSEIVNQIVIDALSKPDCREGCILDGYPRNIAQADYLENATSLSVKAIFFNVKEELLVQRILGRFSCAKCGTIYNSYFSNTKHSGVCDNCGSVQFHYRSDDDKQVLEKRLAEYNKETYPLLDYYKNKGQLLPVDASLSKNEVESTLIDILKRI